MSIYSWYENQINNKKLINNIHQLNLIKAYDNFLTKNKNYKFLNLFKQKNLSSGFYIYGSFGSGKTMLLNTFFNHLNSKKKMRIHFHEFMNQINNNLAHNISINQYCKKLKKQFDFIFLDEFHVTDIATAMLLYNILNNIIKENIIIITTSNYNPDDLYKDGLMRERFIPAIDLIKKNLSIHHLEIKQDFRQIDLNINKETNLILENEFKSRAKNQILENDSILIHNRNIKFIKKSSNIIWFDFKIICGELRSQIDYIELAQLFDYFIIDNIYSLSENDKDIARRFTWLIDILYDASKKIIIEKKIDITTIYINGMFSNEFQRTVSRLHEMQTIEYNQKPIKNILWVSSS